MDPLEMLAKLDVIEPATLAIRQLTSGGNWRRIEFERDAGWAGIEVERELERLHIPICGRGFTSKSEEHPTGTLYCYVPAQQHRWAEYVLRCAGVPLLTVVDERNAAWAAQHDGPVPAWDERGARDVERAATSPARKRRTTPLAELATPGGRRRGGLLARLKRELWD